MKIGLCQIKPFAGKVQENIQRHLDFVNVAISKEAEMIIFPELSLTGYEPTLAKELAIHWKDPLLNVFQEISDQQQVIIGVGIPTKANNGLCISMVLFQPNKERLIYSKKYIHADEEPFFIRGANFPILNINGYNVGLAICYELSVPEHAKAAFESGAEIYVASVAKTLSGVEKAAETLSGIAKKYSLPVLMSNCIGVNDGEECAGKSAAWSAKGELLEQLDQTSEGLLLFDTKTLKTEKMKL